jgi:hypothetical protein
VPVEPARTGEWSIGILDLGDPISVNSEARYIVDLVNNQNQPDRNVRIQLSIPPGVRLINVTASTGVNVPFTSGQDGTVELPPIQFVRPGEQLRYSFVIIPSVAAPSQMRLMARVSSDARPNPQQAVEPVTVIPQR